MLEAAWLLVLEKKAGKHDDGDYENFPASEGIIRCTLPSRMDPQQSTSARCLKTQANGTILFTYIIYRHIYALHILCKSHI